MFNIDLSGKIAIVTGGSQGIGFGIATGLASAGATIVIANRRVEKGQSAVESLRKEGYSAVAIPTDVSNIDSIKKLVAKVMKDFGKIDILVNVAGVLILKFAKDIDEQDWDHIMNTNLRGLFFCCQLVGREMAKNKGGKIINISSNVYQGAILEGSVYATSKAGVAYLTRSLALEWAPYNINVNAIGPGQCITEIAKEYNEKRPERIKELIATVPKGRASLPSDFAGFAVLLASDLADYITGQTIVVDGGAMLR